MTRFRVRITVLALSLAAMVAAPAAADAQTRRAVPRAAAPRSTVIVGARSYNPYYFYRPFYYGAYYSPWYYPFSFGVGFGYGYGPYWGSWGYSPYYAPWGYGPYSGYYGRGYDVSSSVRLQVSPREAEVYVDGYYAGKVDNFDGTFQRLHLEPGDHEVQLFMPGHRSFTQKIYVQPAGTFRVQHVMQPLGTGEAEPTRPVAQPRSSQRSEPLVPPDRPTPRGPQRPQPRDRDDAANVAPDFGSIALRVQPGDATITIDGERWEGGQNQERLVVELGVGTHTVEIRRDGYRTYITDITVRPGETTALNVSLTRQ